MRHFVLPITLLTVLLGTTAARAQTPGSVEQRLAALEAQNAELKRRLNALTNQMQSRWYRPPINEAPLQLYVPGQLGRPLPPGRDRVIREGVRPVPIWKGFGSFEPDGFGLTDSVPVYPYYSDTPAGSLSVAPSSAPTPTPSANTTPTGNTLSAAPAKVTIIVPVGTHVWFDGKEVTTQDGRAMFTSPPLSKGQSVTLSITAEWNQRTHKMNLSMQTGDIMTVDFCK